jgi:ubiquinone/menaquinone biosynthesis C-methylase UbiE
VNLDTARQREKAYHERARAGDTPLPRVEVAETEHLFISPTWESGFDRYNDQRVDFHRRIAADGGVAGKVVLDYGCGDGYWALYFALRGARRVVGFDLAESGIRRGMQRAVAQDQAARVQLVCADATRLPFAGAGFDLVIGHGVIHHVFKYPGVFSEIHRVLRPGGRAYFLENLADNPLFRLWWWWKGEVEEGDVPLFAAALRRETRQFRRVEIVGSDVVHALATFVFRRPLSGWRRAVLRATHRADRALFRIFPAARRWGACSILVLEK